MDIGKLSGQGGGEVGLIDNKRASVTAEPNSPKSTKGADAVTTNVVADFETEQRANVERIGAAVRDGTYRQPDSRTLASALIGGISELQEIFGRQK